MTLELEDRLWAQLEAAAEREARRGRVRRRSAATRARLTLRGAASAGAVAVALVAALAVVVSLPHPPEKTQWQVGQFHLEGRDLGAGASAFGSLWTYDARSAAVLRVDPRTHRVLARNALRTTLPSVAVAAGAGAVWAAPVERITHSSAPAAHPSPVTLVRIDPSTNRVAARVTLRAADGSAVRPVDVVARPGVVWAWGRTGALRVDPARNRVTAAIRLPDETITGFVATDASVSVLTDLGRLVSFDARTGARLSAETVPVAGGSGQKLVAVGGGVVVYTQGGSIESIDPVSGRVRWTAQVESRPRDVAATDRRLWILLSTPGREQVRELDPATGHTIARVTLPADDARSISTAGAGLLVTTERGGVLTVRRR